MKRIFIHVLGLAVLLGSIAPGISFAQVTESSSGASGAANVTSQSATPPQRQVCFSIDSNLSFGNKDRMTNGSVINVQAFLYARGYLKAEPTGYFGVLTLQAVKDFQRANGLPPTGFFGPMSRGKMKALTCDGVITPGEKTISYLVKTDKQVYTQAEPIKIEITVTNHQSQPKTLNFNTGCQTSYMIDNTYNSIAAMLCMQAHTSRTIPANGSYTWTMTHTPQDYQLSVGSHTIKGTVIDNASAETEIKVVASEADKFKLTSPNVGQIWKIGESREIRWSPMTAQETVDIQLLPHTNCFRDPCPLMLIKPYDLALKASANRVFTWTVGNNLENRAIPAGAYDVMVCVNGKPRICDTSDAQIVIEGTVSPLSVKVLNPNGGETMKRGSQYEIKWEMNRGNTVHSSNQSSNAASSAAGSYRISLKSYMVCITTPCEGQKYTIASFNPTHSYTWTVGTLIEKILIPAGNYQVEVCMNGVNICDTSDSYFTITDSPKIVPTITSIQPMTGKVGGTFTIVGNGFTPTSAIKFGGGYIPKELVQTVYTVGGWGEARQFRLPESMGVCNPHISQACIMLAWVANPGTYKVYVENTDGSKSNEVNVTVNGSNVISWQEAVNHINTCNVSAVAQAHNLNVTLTLKNGTNVTAVEPSIDSVFSTVNTAASRCGRPTLVTE